MNTFQILHGDSAEQLRTLPDNSVHCGDEPALLGLRHLFDNAAVLRYNLSQEEKDYVEKNSNDSESSRDSKEDFKRRKEFQQRNSRRANTGDSQKHFGIRSIYFPSNVEPRIGDEIASEFGVTENAIVLHWMDKHGIPRRTISEARDVKHWGLRGKIIPCMADVATRILDGSTGHLQNGSRCMQDRFGKNQCRWLAEGPATSA